MRHTTILSMLLVLLFLAPSLTAVPTATEAPWGTWATQKVNTENGLFSDSSIALDSNGLPHFFVREYADAEPVDGVYREPVVYYEPDGAAWKPTILEAGYTPRIALYQDIPIVAYVTYSNTTAAATKVIRERLPDGSWTTTPFGVNTDQQIVIVASETHGVHVLTYDSRSGMAHLTRNGPGNWTEELITLPPGLTVYCICRLDFAMDASGGLHVLLSYYQYQGPTGLYYYHKPLGGAWSIEKLQTIAPVYFAIGAAPDGTPHIVYQQYLGDDNGLYHLTAQAACGPNNPSNSATTTAIGPASKSTPKDAPTSHTNWPAHGRCREASTTAPGSATAC